MNRRALSKILLGAGVALSAAQTLAASVHQHLFDEYADLLLHHPAIDHQRLSRDVLGRLGDQKQYGVRNVFHGLLTP